MTTEIRSFGLGLGLGVTDFFGTEDKEFHSVNDMIRIVQSFNLMCNHVGEAIAADEVRIQPIATRGELLFLGDYTHVDFFVLLRGCMRRGSTNAPPREIAPR